MSNVMRNVGLWSLSLGLLGWGCSSEDGDDDDGVETAAMDTSSGATGGGDGDGDGDGDGPATTGASAADSSAPETDGTDDGMSPGSSDGDPMGDDGSGSSGGEQAYDEEFMWVAGFLLDNCVACHATNANGAIVLPAPDLTYEEIRLALDGVVANTGLLLVEPGDRNASQTWLQITNEFGAQFPVELTDRFGDWIDAGAAYYAQ